MDTVFIVIGMSLNVMLTSGVLWKLIDFAKGYGKLEHTVETHDREIQILRGQVRD